MSKKLKWDEGLKIISLRAEGLSEKEALKKVIKERKRSKNNDYWEITKS